MTEYSVEKFFDEYALKKEDTIIVVIDSGTNARKVCDLLNEQEETIQELLKYKYLVKALEEVSNAYIEELISDNSDGAVFGEKKQLELGKWHSEHGLSWEEVR